MHNFYVKHIKGLISLMKNISEIFIKFDVFFSFHFFFLCLNSILIILNLFPKIFFKKQIQMLILLLHNA